VQRSRTETRPGAPRFRHDPPRDRARRHVWTSTLWRRESEELADRPRYANDRYLALGLVLLSGGMPAWWW